MPYIKQDDRLDLEIFSTGFPYEQPRVAKTPGELNFQITDLCTNYLDEKDKSYQTINDIIGALEGAKLEFYRRVAAPYEEEKIKENGDVY